MIYLCRQSCKYADFVLIVDKIMTTLEENKKNKFVEKYLISYRLLKIKLLVCLYISYYMIYLINYNENNN